MTQDQIAQILAAIAELRATTTEQIKTLGEENDKADILHDKLDVRITALEKVRWTATGYIVALVGGAGAGSLITQVLSK